MREPVLLGPVSDLGEIGPLGGPGSTEDECRNLIERPVPQIIDQSILQEETGLRMTALRAAAGLQIGALRLLGFGV